MDTVLVTGGTGHLGRELVRLLTPEFRVRVLARTPGTDPEVEWVRGDLATGAGVAQAVAGARIVVHAATLSPSARRGFFLPVDFVRSPAGVDVEGTRRLLQEARSADVGLFAYVSIVGVSDRSIPYLRLKHQAEEMVATSGLPASILRATPFYWLLDRMLGRMARLPAVALPKNLGMQPVDSADFAAHIAGHVRRNPPTEVLREEFAGPEVLPLGEVVRQWERLRRRRLRLVGLPLPRGALTRMTDMETAPGAVRGTTTWEQWLGTHPQE